MDLMNADECLGPRLGWRFARPVFSADGVHWQRVARTNYVRETEQQGYFDFTVPIVGRHTYVAYCYPYHTGDLLRCTHQALKALLLQLMASPVHTTVPILETVVPSLSMAMRQRAIRSNCHAQLLSQEVQARAVP